MSATSFDASAAGETVSVDSNAPIARAILSSSCPAVRTAHKLVRHWTWWLAVPAAMLAGTAYLRLDKQFVAVGLLFGAVIIIRLVQAWSDYDFTCREEAGKLTRREKRRGMGY
jgi:hypothetical protein